MDIVISEAQRGQDMKLIYNAMGTRTLDLGGQSKQQFWTSFLHRMNVYQAEVDELYGFWTERAVQHEVDIVEIARRAGDAATRTIDFQARSEKKDPNEVIFDVLSQMHVKRLHDLLWKSVYTNEMISAVVAKKVMNNASKLIGDDIDNAAFHRRRLRAALLTDYGLKRKMCSPFEIDQRCRPLLEDKTSELVEAAKLWADETDFAKSAGECRQARYEKLEQMQQQLGTLQKLYAEWSQRAIDINAKYDSQIRMPEGDDLPCTGMKKLSLEELRARKQLWKKRLKYLGESVNQLMLETTHQTIAAAFREATEHEVLFAKQEELEGLRSVMQTDCFAAGHLPTSNGVHQACLSLLAELQATRALIQAWIEQNPTGVELDDDCSGAEHHAKNTNQYNV